MSFDKNQMDVLRNILENALQPGQLDSHPWARSLVVRQESADTPELLDKSPGQRLIYAVSRVFMQMMPKTPPRRGKRLDTHWGEFGMLAAEYFSPLLFGEPTPVSLREAWGHIDQSILLFVYGKSGQSLSEAEKEPYKLVGDEPEIAPNSTLSDWHRNGLEHLLEMILQREGFLSRTLSKPAVISGNIQATDSPITDVELKKSNQRSPRLGCYGFLVVGIVLLGCLVFGGLKAWQVYKQVLVVRQDALQIRNLVGMTGPKLDRVKAAGPSLELLNNDFGTLKTEIGPFLWMGSWLAWVPVYGGDLASVQPLINLADHMLSTVNLGYAVITPILSGNNLDGINLSQMSSVLLTYQPELVEAQQQLSEATVARGLLVPENFNP